MPLPTFLIVGAQKAGTTALYRYLRQHPEVFMSPVKEPGHFAGRPGGPGWRWADGSVAISPFRDRAAYEALFADAAGAKARGEASTLYLYVEEAPRRIREELPDVRLIVVLRDPVDRAYSAFNYLLRDGREPITDFSAALLAEPRRRQEGWEPTYLYRDRGLYCRQLRRYLEVFDHDRLRIWLYDDLLDDPRRVMREVFEHVGVDPGFVPDTARRHNVSGVPRTRWLRALRRFVAGSNPVKRVAGALVPPGMRRRATARLTALLGTRGLDPPPRLAPELRDRLVESFREDVRELQELVGRDLSRWLTRR